MLFKNIFTQLVFFLCVAYVRLFLVNFEEQHGHVLLLTRNFNAKLRTKQDFYSHTIVLVINEAPNKANSVVKGNIQMSVNIT